MTRGRRVLFASVTLAATLALIELATRLVLPALWIVPRRPAEDPFLVPHPTRGYAFRSDFTNEWRSADFAVTVRLNELGLRDGSLAEARAGEPRVLALGDSYTFGIGVEQDETWPERLERRLRAARPDARSTVFDAGIPAYGARQIRQLAEELVPRLEPQLLIFAMYTSSFWRVENPYVIFGDTLITTDRVDAMAIGRDNRLLITAFAPGPLRSLDLWLKQHFYLGAHLLALLRGGVHWPERPARSETPEALARAFAPVLVEIDRLDALARSTGARLLVVAVNAQAEDGGFPELESRYNRILAEHCAARGIPFVDPLPALRAAAAGRPIFRFPGDGHWSPAAHALAAELLEQAIEAGSLLPPRAPDPSGAATHARMRGK